MALLLLLVESLIAPKKEKATAMGRASLLAYLNERRGLGRTSLYPQSRNGGIGGFSLTP